MHTCYLCPTMLQHSAWVALKIAAVASLLVRAFSGWHRNDYYKKMLKSKHESWGGLVSYHTKITSCVGYGLRWLYPSWPPHRWMHSVYVPHLSISVQRSSARKMLTRNDDIFFADLIPSSPFHRQVPSIPNRHWSGHHGHHWLAHVHRWICRPECERGQVEPHRFRKGY